MKNKECSYHIIDSESVIPIEPRTSADGLIFLKEDK